MALASWEEDGCCVLELELSIYKITAYTGAALFCQPTNRLPVKESTCFSPKTLLKQGEEKLSPVHHVFDNTISYQFLGNIPNHTFAAEETDSFQDL